jgi:hypothetical protein
MKQSIDKCVDGERCFKDLDEIYMAVTVWAPGDEVNDVIAFSRVPCTFGNKKSPYWKGVAPGSGSGGGGGGGAIVVMVLVLLAATAGLVYVLRKRLQLNGGFGKHMSVLGQWGGDDNGDAPGDDSDSDGALCNAV